MTSANPIAFHTGSWIGRALGWRLPFDWERAEREGIRTWSLSGFEQMIQEIAEAGFFAVELYQAHAVPLYMTRWLARDMKAILTNAGVRVIAFSGFLGDGAAPHWTEQVMNTCEWLEIPLAVGGFAPAALPQVRKEAKRRGIRVAFENHTQRTPKELLRSAGLSAGAGASADACTSADAVARPESDLDPDWLGVCVDTGWWATEGCDPAAAIRALAPHLVHVHLKDVDRTGSHHSCRPGKGLVDIDGVLQALGEVGYQGAISLEHECEEYDPLNELRELRVALGD